MSSDEPQQQPQQPPPQALQYYRGRGALSNRESRYAATRVEHDPSEGGWRDGTAGETKEDDPDFDLDLDIAPRHPATTCVAETAKSIIARNKSPDIPFSQSINPYRGCEHGCIYCYARPSHAYLDYSPGLDFETRLSYKHNAAALLEQELRRPGYKCSPISLGANTDPYQPMEKTQRLTRQVLQVLHKFRHPFTIVTRSTLVSRDLDLLAEMAAENLCSVAVSVTTLQRDLKRVMEPRAPSGEARLATIRRLSEAGVPVSVMFAPVIPALNDSEMEQVLERAAAAGASGAGYVLLRLPLEIHQLFEEWLQQHYPLKAGHVMNIVRETRGGHHYDSRFGHRMRGQGVFAELIAKRFEVACRKHGLGGGRAVRSRELDCSQFAVPPAAGDQFELI